ncbi:MAG TPA: peptidoglycan editing factor PgeF [Thiobacillaceae bacterium]|nr:peptidoglycan editing factor PgeF [Thiobacillaceae bacterium]HNU63023.1 peptidoglycan editing factor PgeF [Thiobacillaceae bacterium]
MQPDWILPDWPAPGRVKACMSTRIGGVSRGPYACFNTATHVGDDPAAVAENRRLLRQHLPDEPCWLDQVHGVDVLRLESFPSSPAQGKGNAPPTADASMTRRPGQVCVVQTADCLPVLFCDEAGTVVAAAHAGWRGLAAGVLEATVRAMGVAPHRLLAWLGPAIGPQAFEVGEEVREIFVGHHPLTGVAFRPALPGTLDGTPRKWLADIYALARIRLAAAGVEAVHGGDLCTHTDAGRFFSYRRDGKTGRMACLIWLQG